MIGIILYTYIKVRGAGVEWLVERLGYGAEKCWRMVSLRLGFAIKDWKTLSVSPAVNGYLFQIREG